MWFPIDWHISINVSENFAVSSSRVTPVGPPSRGRFHFSMKHRYLGLCINLQGMIMHEIAIFTFLCAPFLLLYKEVVSEAQQERSRRAGCRTILRHPVWDNQYSALLRKRKGLHNNVLLITWFLTYMFNSGPTWWTLYSLFLSSLALHVSGAICTHHRITTKEIKN
jgi:hypothetical protein